MKQPTFLEKLQSALAASFHVLEPAKAKRMHAKTMYIPCLEDVAKAIQAFSKGETRTIVDLRLSLAIQGNAETACPGAMIKYWKWMAQAHDEAIASDLRFAVPWWRVLKDGKPSRHMPGGVEGQLARLEMEKENSKG
jgi:hypothetical protein